MKQVQFTNTPLPFLLLAPQVIIVSIFFFWPAFWALWKSLFVEDPFMGNAIFTGLDNFMMLFEDSSYWGTFAYTLLFSLIVSLGALSVAMVLAVNANAIMHRQARNGYRSLIMWIYAVAPALAGFVGASVFNQHFGTFTHMLQNMGIDFNIAQNGTHASIAIILMSIWKQVSVNFIFLLAGLQNIPNSVKEASSLDCRSPMRRFWTITFPLLAPTNFFLLVINTTYAFFETFGVIDLMTFRGFPGGKTLVYEAYKAYRDQDYGGSAAQCVVLMIVVFLLTFIQFRFIERKIHY
ncbi:MAG: ABC transporter permease subunit [Alphaproteobacteria bacterium]